MTHEELDLLCDEAVRRTIETHRESDPAKVALVVREHGALVATQVKYLQRARTKLPSYYRAGCILPPLAFEQASSEQTAALKDFRGGLCVDLTCGLGVDTLYLARGFRRVVAIERDEVTAAVARINFSRLGATHIDVLTLAAEDFLNAPAAYTLGEPIDLIYIDPARRGARGEKLFRLEDCSPDVVALMPSLLALSPRVVVKASPLFDVGEAFRLFGDATGVEVVSWHDECKEVLIDIRRPGPDGERSAGWIRALRAEGGSLRFTRVEQPAEDQVMYDLKSSDVNYSLKIIHDLENILGYLLVPDVSLYKSRLVEAYARAVGIGYTSPTGYCFAEGVPEGFFGRSYPIEHIFPYQPKKLKAFFKAEGVTQLEILKKDFPQSAGQIAAALSLREGGQRRAAFTRVGSTYYMILLAHA